MRKTMYPTRTYDGEMGIFEDFEGCDSGIDTTPTPVQHHPACANCHKPHADHWQLGGGGLKCSPDLDSNSYTPSR